MFACVSNMRQLLVVTSSRWCWLNTIVFWCMIVDCLSDRRSVVMYSGLRTQYTAWGSSLSSLVLEPMCVVLMWFRTLFTHPLLAAQRICRRSIFDLEQTYMLLHVSHAESRCKPLHRRGSASLASSWAVLNADPFCLTDTLHRSLHTNMTLGAVWGVATVCVTWRLWLVCKPMHWGFA